MLDILLCESAQSLLSAMQLINENGKGMVFVVDHERALLGVLTDGDIRRALLDGKQLGSTVVDVLNPNYVFSYQCESYEQMVEKMVDGIDVMPVVSDEKQVVDFFEYKKSIHLPIASPNLNGNEFKYLTDAFLSTWISSSGSYIKRFEQNFAAYSDCEFGVAVSNGTVALHLALVALGLGPGDEVIIPDLTFAATINAVLHAGATPVIVDVEQDSWCICPQAIKVAITSKTKAIIPVHLYGQPCDMGSIMHIAQQHQLKVIEDCAEAHGAQYDGKKVGSFGDIGCFSFYGNKVITTGEGGMCVTSCPKLLEKMRLYRDHGMSKEKRYWHEVVGYNYRMTNLQAAIGLAQLERIDNIHQNRSTYEERYRSALLGKLSFQSRSLPARSKITWLIAALATTAEEKKRYLDQFKAVGIEARPFFYPLSDMPIYQSYCHNETPVTHDISARGLNLPAYECLQDVKSLEQNLKEFYRASE